MAHVALKVQISGTRNGEPWPEPGVPVDLPEDEAAHLVEVGIADPVDVEPEPVKEPTAAEKKAAEKAAAAEQAAAEKQAADEKAAADKAAAAAQAS